MDDSSLVRVIERSAQLAGDPHRDVDVHRALLKLRAEALLPATYSIAKK